jgi:nitroreductase
MKAMELLIGRCSAVRLTEPGPTEEDLELMIMSAVRAPDHGRLRPWRFVVIRKEAREKFGEVLALHLLRKMPSASQELLENERRKALRAPLIVVVAQKSRPSEKIPAMEQILSAGAAAQNILLAAYALGYGAMWKTGSAAYDEDVKAAFGLDEADTIVGFIYIGSHTPPRPLPRPAIEDFVEVWTGDDAHGAVRPVIPIGGSAD